MSNESTTADDRDLPDVLKKVYSANCRPGAAILSLASASGMGVEDAALAATALLGGIGGTLSAIAGPADNRIIPGFNLVVAGVDDPGWGRLLQMLLEPIADGQRLIRNIGRAAIPQRLATAPDANSKEDRTAKLLEMGDHDLWRLKSASKEVMKELRGAQTLRLTSLVLSSPAPDVFERGLEELLDRQALVTYPTGRLLDEVLRVAPNRRWLELLTMINAALDGQDVPFKSTHADEGCGRLAQLEATLFVACSTSTASHFLRSTQPDIETLRSNCLVVPSRLGDPRPRCDRQYMCTGYERYCETVSEIFGARRSGKSKSYRPNDFEYALLREYSEFIEPDLRQCVTVPRRGWLLDLPSKVVWALTQLNSHGDYPNSIVPFAIHVAHTAVMKSHGFIEAERSKFQALEIERRQKAVLERMAQLGQCRLRELVRTFRYQRKEHFLPLLEDLELKGEIVRIGDLYALPEKSAGAES
jgi:hypothetical protein